MQDGDTILMEEDNNKSIWNIDEAEHKLIFLFKESTAMALKNWELSEAYWNLRSLAAEIDARLNSTEQKELDKIVDALDIERNKYQTGPNDSSLKGNFFVALIEAYKLSCRLLKKHGTFFREIDDDEGL